MLVSCWESLAFKKNLLASGNDGDDRNVLVIAYCEFVPFLQGLGSRGGPKLVWQFSYRTRRYSRQSIHTLPQNRDHFSWRKRTDN